MWFSHVGSENGTLTAYKTKNGIELVCGCFHGSDSEFLIQVDTTHGNSKIGKEYRLLVEVIRSRFGE